MNEVKYKLAESGEFVIKNFNKAKAFSSFFPGIAGLDGIPLWTFYVNRGQCVSSFGTKDKDGAILEFLSANQAYTLTPLKGFRTFLKVKKGGRTIFHEPFRDADSETARHTSTKMIISPSNLEIEEINRYLGIAVNVSYITIPNEPFAALARKASLTNISKKKIDIEIIDGLPQIISFGITEDLHKLMSRTMEAWVKVSNLENKAPFYALKVKPNDTPELEYVERGNFYLACEMGKRAGRVLKPIVDPDIVFGADGDISYPRVFAESRTFFPDGYQKTECRTPSAFAHTKFGLASGETREIISITGNIKDIKGLNSIISKIKDKAYFEKKLSENEDIIKGLQDTVFTKSSSNEFDHYCRQTFLDNLLRGGFPVTINTPSGPFVFYAYARKHGDLERDYNSFLLQPSYYSQGNGAYRDINQNRRNDLLFNPDLKYDNISTFINAIQPDGFNPHQIEGISLSLKSGSSINAVKKVREFLKEPFTPGSLISFLETEGIMSKKRAREFLKDVLAISIKSDLARPGEGYWVDHWTYNLDLLETYLLCYPENLKELLLGKRDFTFYDTYLRVNPRDEKYVYADGKIRQFGAVSEDGEKKRLIEKRGSQPYKVRVKNGIGRIYETSLFVKLACVLANKISSLDPFGIGIEMEAGKPGWCDSLNNLPGIFGSSVPEAFELKRLILFLKSSLDKLGIDADYKIAFPCELADFLIELDKLLAKTDNFKYWDVSSTAKERYRRKVWFGFDGREKYLSVSAIKSILDEALLKIERGLRAAEDKKTGLPYTYFINEVKKYKFIYERGKRKLNKDGLPLVKALSFGHKPVSFFLEGPMHAMRVMEAGKKAESLYKAVKKSELFDRGLKMYKVNAPLKGMPFELGRSTIFTPGWLENESIWLHMEYKYMLEVLRKGLYAEFFSDLKNCLVAFQDPSRYGRSILENSSFIASSAYPDKSIRGNGFVARLTGSTTEFLSIWLLMCLGKEPFKVSGGKLYFELKPILPGWLFTAQNTFAFCLLGKTLVVYHNPKKLDTFGDRAVRPTAIELKRKDESDIKFTGSRIPSPFAERVRQGYYDRIDVNLS